jgi:Protein of unknown function (DUF429)
MDAVSIGIDATTGREPFTLAVLDKDLRPLSLLGAELEDLLDCLGSYDQALVALNAPSHVSLNIVGRRMERDSGASHALRGAEVREAEFELHALGIAVAATPHAEALCPAWIQSAFDLYRSVAGLGYKPYPKEDAPRQWIETHPHAGFCVLLGRAPLAKPTLEGRLQRALVLHERGVRIDDPMTFLEEITRHRVLAGDVSTGMIPAPAELDALVAAYTAWLAMWKPKELSQLGNKQEGFITLPAAALKTNYQL